ncbi:hypothetical protein IHQ71_16455 [Rhizobium sp. TH2]|uniref:hypothetical protein n=1 Tax=Rhizobium sp. TH2 TaxID=2775403 RepID=UPI0021586442|nr:hypothetical protein [Rhizobium sp. TH2]UVC06842.1 hypothetical protein IHQ71_16455 [Rhizobium sp. TH2]
MKAMKAMSTLLRVLSLFALVGMLSAPVSTIAAELTMADMSRATSVAMDQMAGMEGDMPCCPDQQPVKPDCDKSCPFVIICSTSAPIALLKAEWTSASVTWTNHVYGEPSFARLNSLAAEPPARPPKA